MSTVNAGSGAAVTAASLQPRVRPYPAMLCLGIALGLVAGDVAARVTGLDAARVYVGSVLLLVPALLGARVVAVGADVVAHRLPIRVVFRRTDGGQAMYGGLLAVPVSVPLLSAIGVPFWPFWDVATVTILVGMVFARIGCLLTGCCAGRTTGGRFGLVLRDADGVVTRRIPTQLLEAAAALVILGADAVFIGAHATRPGVVFAGSLAAYASARVALQPLRRRQTRVAGLPVARVASVALALAGVAVVVWVR